MSCSKIFSGDLPELTYDIIKYFQNDFSTLHSFILVNRLWCRLAIPLLWENPFSIPTKNYNFIKIYLHSLNGDLRTKLNEYKINYNSLPSNTLFNYTKFLKYLNTWEFTGSVATWSENILITLYPGISHISEVSNFTRLILMSLLKMIIENEVNLYTLDIAFYNYNNYNYYYDDIFGLILQNPNFIYSVRNINLYIGGSSFLYHINDEYTSIKCRILQIINLHQNLKKIIVSFNILPLYQSLLLSKDYNCSNSLNTIIFNCINFESVPDLGKIFEQLNVLESIHIIYCYPLNIGFIQPIANLTKPFKLKSLFINWRSQTDESLQLLLRKSGDYLENFECGNHCSLPLKQQLLEFLIKYCKSIKFLSLCGFEKQIIFSVLNSIENCKQSLNCLSIDASKTFKSDDSPILLQNLGQSLPFKLEYLRLSFKINISDFKIFLQNSQNTFIKKLLIKNLMKKDSDGILPCIKEHIMKGKRVRYLAFRDFRYKELFDLKDLVKEFELYNIIVQRYSDLYIDIYQYIKKCD
jgi:hypothetical protein